MYLWTKTFAKRLSRCTTNPYTWHIQEFRRLKILSKGNTTRMELANSSQITIEDAQHAKP